MNRNIVGPKVRKLRYERGLSQAELAAKCQLLGWGVSRDIIAAIEGRKRCVIDVELVGLAAALGVSEGELLPSRKESISFLKSDVV